MFSIIRTMMCTESLLAKSVVFNTFLIKPRRNKLSKRGKYIIPSRDDERSEYTNCPIMVVTRKTSLPSFGSVLLHNMRPPTE